MLKKYIATCFFLAMVLQCLSQASVLRSGKWYKFSVTSDGIYKIDYNLLKNAGINPDAIDPKKISLYAAGNGMLPQLNSASRITDLAEIKIFVSGEEDGKFNKEDFVLFFAQGPDAIEIVPDKSIFHYENHLYSDKNFYFLTVSEQNGKRLGLNENVEGTYPAINQYDDFAFYENDKYNILNSGREWFGEQFDTSTELKIRFDITDIVENSSIKVVSQVMSQSIEATSFKLSFNNIEIDEQPVDAIPNTQYGIKGRKKTDTITFNGSIVNASALRSQEIKYQYIKSAIAHSVGYLDFIQINCKRKLNWAGKALIFVSSESLQNPVSTFQITNLPSTANIWEITDPFNVNIQSVARTDSKGQFSTATTTLKKFIAFNDIANFPVFENAVENQNLHSLEPCDLLIITHPTFKTEADRLAIHRQSNNKINVQVVTVDQIYNEYSGGKQDITAIRDYARALYYSGGLKNLLLFGRCSYDYKDKIFNNTNFVPTYESRNSLSPLETYSSDDYFGFFEPTEGEWRENPVQNHTMEIGVGRISVKKLTDAQNIVDKLISYDLNPNAYGHWRNDIVFVADDGDFNLHQGQASQLADNIELTHPEFNTTKLFLDSYKQYVRLNSGQYSPEATDALNRAINKGALIVNFTGHGSEQVWMQEKMFQPSSIEEWTNKNHFPLFVTATCEFGRHDDPLLISSGELIMSKKNAGGIGLVTTARPVFSGTNFVLNQAFYRSLFEKVNGTHKNLGTIFRDTKNQSLSDISNRNFSLLGDPSMQLAIPEKEIIINEIKTANGSDTLKALSNVIIKGEIKNTPSFNGFIHTIVFDKESTSKTLGDENPVFSFKEFNHILFQGTASVENGHFEVQSIIPKTIDYNVDHGKLNLYAYTENKNDQAAGAKTNFKIGMSESLVDVDTRGPDITLLLGDTTYRTGGVVGTNTYLVAKLYDEHGIAISGYENGNLEITLDDTLFFVGNRYYEAEVNNYKNGLMNYPIVNLAKGNHTLKLKAWDTYGNSSEKSIDFVVGDANQLIIDYFFNYPNPVTDKTTIQFSHNRPGEDMDAQLIIYNSVGELISNAYFTISESSYTVTLTEWDGTANARKLSNGIYFMKLIVRSQSDGAKTEKFTKLILLN